ncbi:MAG TPA: response regulator [Pseudomonadales bacterium]|nr:response regulator [Pseudomonadales bacterium]
MKNAQIIDRNVLKKHDQSAVRASMVVTLAYLVVGLWIIFIGEFYKASLAACVSLGSFILITSLLRIAMSLWFDKLYGEGPLRWRRIFHFANNLQALAWSAFTVLLLVYTGLSDNTFIAWMLSGGVGASILINSPLYRQSNKILMSIYWLPTSILLLLSLNPAQVFIASALFLYYFFSLRQVESLYNSFLEKEEMQRRLNKKIIDLERVKNAEERSQSSQQQFIQNITHEIRTPLNNILGMLSLLEDSDLNKTQHEYQLVATRSAQTLLELIDDALDFSKISSGEINFQKNFFSIRTMIEECLEILGPVAHEKKLELGYVCEAHIPLRIKGDAKRIKQILFNLVSNAIKYSTAGEIIVEAHLIFSDSSQGMLRVEVSDQGLGISPHDQQHIFEAFNRLDQGEYNSGAGLGLTICRGLVHGMQGDMGLRSKEGQGSTFWFSVPVKVSTQQGEVLKAHAGLVAKRVLVLSQSRVINRFLQTEMAHWGIDAVFADDYPALLVQRADNASRSNAFDLVIMNMPLDKVLYMKLSQQLFDDEHLSSVPQIILCSLAQRGSVFLNSKNKIPVQVNFLSKPLLRKNVYSALLQVWQLSHDKIAEVMPLLGSNSGNEQSCSVLLVEDNNVNQLIASTLLAKLGCQVRVVSNGVEALGCLAEKTFDLILMDCVMPLMDGYETTRKIREKESALKRHTPIIAMTAMATEENERHCFEAGMDDYLTKPITLAALEFKLQRWYVPAEPDQEELPGFYRGA